MKKNGQIVLCAQCDKSVYRKQSAISATNFCSQKCVTEYGGKLFKDRRGTLEERFWSKVRKTDDCWLWIGAVNANGYGGFGIDGKTITASRVAWILQRSESCAGKLVCHKCDNPLCMRGDHLFLGSDADNRQDCVQKGRAHGAVGERNCKAKLTSEKVNFIRFSGYANSYLAATFGVDPNTIRSIRKYETWNK